MNSTDMFNIATTALLKNCLYGVSEEEKILDFFRSEVDPIYLLDVTRKLDLKGVLNHELFLR